MIGYRHPLYAYSVARQVDGSVLPLKASGGHLIERTIPGTPHRDAMGSYPMFDCNDWRCVVDDIEAQEHLVSTVLVSDPFRAGVRELDWDVCRMFKHHYVALLDDCEPCDHHWRNIKKASDLRVSRPPVKLVLDEWCQLYRGLIEHHGITGVQAFDRDAFRWQFEVPGLTAFRAMLGGETVSMLLFYRADKMVYYHLGASTPEGYDHSASFALMWAALRYYRDRGAYLLDLGAGAGLEDEQDGLTRWKRGWSERTLPVYLCGKVLRQNVYDELGGSASYFPAYRGERDD